MPLSSLSESIVRDNLEPSFPITVWTAGRFQSASNRVVRLSGLSEFGAPHRVGKKATREFVARSSAGEISHDDLATAGCFLLFVRFLFTKGYETFVSAELKTRSYYQLAIECSNDQPKAVLHLVSAVWLLLPRTVASTW